MALESLFKLTTSHEPFEGTYYFTSELPRSKESFFEAVLANLEFAAIRALEENRTQPVTWVEIGEELCSLLHDEGFHRIRPVNFDFSCAEYDGSLLGPTAKVLHNHNKSFTIKEE